MTKYISRLVTNSDCNMRMKCVLESCCPQKYQYKTIWALCRCFLVADFQQFLFKTDHILKGNVLEKGSVLHCFFSFIIHFLPTLLPAYTSILLILYSFLWKVPMRFFSTWFSSHTLKSFEPRIYFHLVHSWAEKEVIKRFH